MWRTLPQVFRGNHKFAFSALLYRTGRFEIFGRLLQTKFSRNPCTMMVSSLYAGNSMEQTCKMWHFFGGEQPIIWTKRNSEAPERLGTYLSVSIEMKRKKQSMQVRNSMLTDWFGAVCEFCMCGLDQIQFSENLNVKASSHCQTCSRVCHS